MDQSSALGGGELVLVKEYDGNVDDPSSAQDAVERMGGADLALLSGHGVFVVGATARSVHQRAVALEQRCCHAWHVLAAGGPLATSVPDWWIDKMKQSDGDRFIGFWEAMVRNELRADPTLLEQRH
jgi:ribulose-5-phosphate 4-epimerase/fuculose-1-phosphate aldolase